MAKLFAKDTYIWLIDDEDAYHPARVKATFQAGNKGTVTNLITEASYTVSAAESRACIPMDEQSLKPIQDMVLLKQLDEPALLHNLRLRYEEDEIYTAIGSILVSVNPFKTLNIYTPEIVDNYINDAKNLPPHIYLTADNAYNNLVQTKRSQSCIVSGESGAGKTEATKLFLQYLAEKASAGDEKAKSGATMLHQKILEANPVMEAFGNAKTLRNNNSSRFGKLIKVDFDNKLGKIVGGNITSYLLEKSRIVFQADGERNYHIFYQLCTYASMDPEFNKDLQLQDASQYYYTNPNDNEDNIIVDGINDMQEFENTMNAFNVLEFSEKEKDQLMRVVAVVLLLGNIEFVGDDERSQVKEQSLPVVKRAADLFGCDSLALADSLVRRKVREFFKEHSLEEAISARDALAKATYSFMFNWLIEKINKSLSNTSIRTRKKNISTIAVLDIFGFESFRINSFEQLCINYCNEKLQSHFNDHIFSLEQKLYAEEGVDLQRIDFTDNQPTLDMIEGKQGVLSILDEVSRTPKGTDDAFLKKIHNKVDGVLLKKPGVKELRDAANQIVFTVAHYAGDVSYTVTNFLEKNKDRLLEGLYDLGAGSSNKFIAKLFSSMSSGDGKKSIGGLFRSQLKELMMTLSATDPHYVRTIKPNENKAADEFTAPMVLDQMRYAGLMEVCKIRKMGYPVRRTFQEFYKRYKPLASDLVAVQDHEQLCANLEKHGILEAGEYAVGKTKIFMRDAQFDEIEIQRAQVLGAVAIKMQRVIRGFVARQKFKRYKTTLDAIAQAIKKREINAIETALRGTGILPFVGKHLPIVQQAKKLVAELREEKRVLTLIAAATKSRDIMQLESAIAAAEQRNMNSFDQVQAAIALCEQLKKEKVCLDKLEAAVATNTIESLEDAIGDAQDLKLNKSQAYKDATAALRYLRQLKTTIEALEAANKTKNAEEIVKYLTKMAELGKTDHPAVQEGQEITKEIARVSEETQKQIKALKKNIDIALKREDLSALKKLRPQAIKFGLDASIVENATTKIQYLEKKAQAFNELTASKQALEIKYEGFDGVNEDDLNSFTTLIKAAMETGFTENDEEMGAMRDFENKMTHQIEAQTYLAEVLKTKEEPGLRKALAMIQDLGLKTGSAKQIEEEVQLIDQKVMEQRAAAMEKERAQIKETLEEGDEDARDDEKAMLLEEQTEEHQHLIAKAADNNYHFTNYYKIREDSEYVSRLPEEVQERFAAMKLRYQNKNLPQSLLQFPKKIAKTAVQVYKAILQYCGDLSNPYPNTMAKFMIVTSLENPILVDEVYMQLMKHLTQNPKPVSEDRGWGLMCMMTSAIPPSAEFAPYLVNFFIQNRTVPGLIGNYAKLCIVQLDGRIRLGPTKLIPDQAVIDTYSQRPPICAVVHRVGEEEDPMMIPVTPDEDLDKVLLETIYPKLDIEEERQHLYGLFVIDGRPDTDLDLRTRLERFYQKYNPAKLQHVDYFVNAWGENMEGLFHKLETKYGPEPTEEEVEQALRKRGKETRVQNFLSIPITAAKQAAKRLGLASAPQEPPPSPQTAWPIPWWVYLGDVFLRMVKQNRVPIFSFKRKLFQNGEPMTRELLEQNMFDVVKGNLAVSDINDVVDLAAIHLTLRNDCEVPKGEEEIIQLGLVDALPVTWLSHTQPKKFIPRITEQLPKLKGAGKKILQEKYMQICRKQPSYGMWFFFLAKPNSKEIEVAGVDTAGVHIMNEERTAIKTTYGYRTIKEYGAGQSVFWMKVVKKENGKSVEKTVNLQTIQAWDLYGLVYDYTFNADKLKLK